MLTRLMGLNLLSSAIATTIAFAILVSLGTWQMQRKAWKENLLQQIAERTHAAPQPYAQMLDDRHAGKDLEYTHVSVRGRWLHDKEQYVWMPSPDFGPGYHVYTPLEFDTGRVVWVNRGFVPLALKEPQGRAEGQATSDVTVTGLMRRPLRDPGMFAPDGEPDKRIYYWRDLDGMQAAAFGGQGPSASPYFIDADAEPANPGGWPKGGVTLVQLPNRHLEYALTWFGLAGTLLAIYAAFVVSRLRGDNEVV